MRAAIALGSNLPSPFGDPSANLLEAVRRLKSAGVVLAVSSFYQTDPVGLQEQPRFTNAAMLVDTSLQAHSLLQTLLEIERSMGRRREADAPPKGPRVIDLDLLLLEDEGVSVVLQTPNLTLPHPEMLHRRFVLEPLAEIAPEMVVLPGGLTVAAHLSQLMAGAATR